MKPIPAFETFAFQFHQDIWLLHRELDSAIDSALGALSPEDKRQLEKFLVPLAEQSPDIFAKLWNESDAAIGMPNGREAADFLSAAIRQLRLQVSN